ncbi:unnamed protein product [Effrenium voratum]|uniref:Uncharacterized protein n=1 Tax=Effrenium voratum TaxID=2562239 RepID=A0AA36IAM5_9DINO|nr:unnamed protein product [Effrenium voratum]
MPCLANLWSPEEHFCTWAPVGPGRGRGLQHFFGSFAESADDHKHHDSADHVVSGKGKGEAKASETGAVSKHEEHEVKRAEGSKHPGKAPTGADADKPKDAEAAAKPKDASSAAEAKEAESPKEDSKAAKSEEKEEAKEAKAGEDGKVAEQGKSKGKGKSEGKGVWDDAKGKGKGKWKGKGKGKGGHHGSHRSHSRSSSHGRHRHRHRSHSGHSHSGRSRRHSSGSKRRHLKKLLHRERQLRSHSPRRRRRSHSWRYGDRLRMGYFPSKSLSSLRRSVGLLQTEDAPLQPELSVRHSRRQATAFLFNVGKDAQEADQVDQETDQQEVEEEAKTIVNEEGAGYDVPIGVEQGEVDEIDHVMEERQQALWPEPAGEPPGEEPEMYEGPRDPRCPCPEWDPMKTALPEDKQHASLVMLQRRIRPENQVAPSLREAAAAVEHAGRLFEGWVRRRQQLADVLPELSLKMEYCRNRAKDFASSAAENALQAMKDRMDEEDELEEGTEKEVEMAEGEMAFEAIGEAQEDYNEQAAQDMQHHGQYAPDGGLYDQTAFISAAARKPTRVSFQAGAEQLAEQMGKIYGTGGPPPGGEPPPEEVPPPPQAEEEQPTLTEAEEEMAEDEEVEQAEEVEDWGDFFRECGEFRIPPTVLAARRAANEAYWAFDKAMGVAERKVGKAIQHSLLRGA